MTKHQRVLKLYKAGLRLYPKAFRETYGEQALLTAQDTLDTTTSPARTSVRLIIDLLCMALIENIRQTEENMTKPSNKTSLTSALSAALLGFQIVAIAAISYVYVNGTIQDLTSPRPIDTPVAWWLTGTIMPSAVFAALLVVAFVLLRKVAHFSLWSRITWSYTLWVGGAVGYFLFCSAADSLMSLYALNGIAGFVGKGLGLGIDQIVLALIYLAGFYLFMQKLVQLLQNSRPATTR